MFQNFDDIADPSSGVAHLATLRDELAKRGLDGFIVPRADAHQGEYIPASEARLQWLTGFAGSAGVAVVLKDKAAIFVDGRYTLQVREQVDVEHFVPQHLIAFPPASWLEENLSKGMRIGLDPMLHSVNGVRRLHKACHKAGAELVMVSSNPIDAIWTDRPEPPLGQVALHPDELAGETAASKMTRIGGELREQGVDAVVLTQPDSIAWLFNIRGSDVEHTPLPLCFALVEASGRSQLFIDGRKLTNSVRDSLSKMVSVEDPEAFMPALEEIGGDAKTVLLDPDLVGQAIRSCLVASGSRVVEGPDPILLPKAIKNDVEIAGSKAAHLRDAIAFAKFLHWFDKTAPSGELDEIGATEALEQFRLDTGVLKDISFDTIAGADSNGAICHYRVSRKSNRKIPVGKPFLIDSGAQFADGTTDITRTIAVGEMTPEMKRHNTIVLKGHIGIATARFPLGTTGAQLDALARMPLWKAGLDFDHGTGHGVGSYLSVHEGPQRIAKTGFVPLVPGMIISNEPGYYPAGQYGIRIENLELVTAPQEINGGERPMLGFEELTLVPIDTRLVEVSMLSAEERDWLNAYHQRVWAEVGPHLEGDCKAWLETATQAI